MLKSLVYGVYAIAAAVLPFAQSVSASEGLTGWVAQVNRQIEQKMAESNGDRDGSAQIVFRRGADGRATDLERLSGSRAVAAEAIRTARQLRDLPPLPPGFPADQRITMSILIMGPSDPRGYEKARTRMLASANAQNAQLAARATGQQVASLEPR